MKKLLIIATYICFSINILAQDSKEERVLSVETVEGQTAKVTDEAILQALKAEGKENYEGIFLNSEGSTSIVGAYILVGGKKLPFVNDSWNNGGASAHGVCNFLGFSKLVDYSEIKLPKESPKRCVTLKSDATINSLYENCKNPIHEIICR